MARPFGGLPEVVGLTWADRLLAEFMLIGFSTAVNLQVTQQRPFHLADSCSSSHLSLYLSVYLSVYVFVAYVCIVLRVREILQNVDKGDEGLDRLGRVSERLSNLALRENFAVINS